MPIAIQLYANKAKEDNPVWTPKDAHNDWLLAKICVNNAVGQEQQLIDHLLYAHLCTEPYAIALRRCLARTHPIYKLLFPHLQLVHAINTRFRHLGFLVTQYLYSIGKNFE